MGNKKNAKRANAAKKAPKRGSRKAKPSPTEAPKKKRASPRLAKVDMDASEDDTSRKTRRSTGKEKESNEKNATMEQEVESETEPPSKKEKADDSPHDDAKKKSPHEHHHHHHHHHHHEHHLNEETLKRLKDYLSSERLNEGLDEDAIALKILRTEKQTLERVKFLHGPYVDSDDENDSDSAQQTQSYQAAEEYTIALEFYKRIVAEVQSENPDKKLDLKTLNWLRRALGLHRRAELLAATVETREEEEREGETDESEDEGNGSQADKKKRTATRGRSSRIKKKAARRTKESMNLNALTSAVDDLEKELGPFTKKRKRDKDASPREESAKVPKVAPPAKEKTEKPAKPKAKRKDIFDRTLTALIPDKKPKPKRKDTKRGRAAKRNSKNDKVVKVRVLKPVKGVRSSQTKPKQSSNSAAAREASRHFKKAALRKRKMEITEARDKKKGRMFTEMDPHGSMDLSAADYVDETKRVSLGLLEWKRRNERGNAPKWGDVPFKIPRKLEEVGITGDISLWDSVNPIPHATTKPAAIDPARRRHSDAKYAEYIASMIRILSGSGRSWALHEFFYSDIDRAWFNFDQFRVDIAKLGVPPDARLTRKEWSLVRRSLPKRPRRFSRRFIQSELAKLCQYRDIVRALQHSEQAMPDFGFDVPAYIKIGATVTAIHWKRRVLHRGVVLSHDPRRSGYLVQFERQELGFQFCPDYEIASHGVPEILIKATSSCLDASNIGAFSNRNAQMGELPYGTSYGSLYADQPSPVMKDKQAKVAKFSPVVGNDDAVNYFKSSSSALSTVDNANRVAQARVAQAAERETLVELIGTIDAALKRKNELLHAICKCNNDITTMKANASSPASAQLHQGSPLMAHYSWLHANLRATNESLETSLVLLQTMYGKAYSGMEVSPEEMQEQKNGELEVDLQRLIDEDTVDERLASQWKQSLAHATDKVGSLLARSISNAADKSDSMSEEEKLRAEYVDSTLTAACRLLLNVNYFGALIESERSDVGSSDRGLTLGVAPMNACLERELSTLQPKPLPQISESQEGVARLHEIDAKRTAAMKKLQEAVAGFETELATLHTAKKIMRSS